MCEKQRLEKILTSIVEYAKETFDDALDAVILYGSYARGDYDAESDIDVMVLVDMDANALMQYESQFSCLTSELSLADDECTTISLLLKDKETYYKWLHVVPFYQNVEREGVRISA